MARPVSFLWLGLSHLLEKRHSLSLALNCLSSAIDAHGKAPFLWRMRQAHLQIAMERYAQAVDTLREVVRQAPGHFPAWFALGNAYLETGAVQEAVQLYEGLLARDPASLDARNAYGHALLAHKEPARALEVFESVLAEAPTHAKANSNRAAALLSLKRPLEAAAAARASLALPGAEQAVLELNLGSALIQQGEAPEGILHLRRALELDPALSEAKLRLAIHFGSRSLIAESIPYLERKLQREGRGRELEEHLAVAYLCGGQFERAEATCRAILEKYPDSSQAWMSLANVHEFRRDLRGALDCLEHSLAIQPDSFAVFSNILFLMQSLPGVTAEELFDRHCAWWERYRDRFNGNAFTYERADVPGRRLKVGYVSGDLMAHPVGYLLLPALVYRDSAAFEIHCFSNVVKVDEVTKLLRANVDQWHDVVGLNLNEVADLVHDSGIDILVDLAGHTDRNLLAAFARRPAPVQVSWLGYFHSTGTDCLDYFISDPHTTPPDSSQRYSETLVHLPHSRFCFVPRAAYPEPAPSPVFANGHITFGCFNRLNKITPEVVHVWARILAALPGSVLLLKANGLQDDLTCEQLLDQFAAHGIDAQRIELRAPSPYLFMLEQYADMDIALDPFPFNGGMTTLEALWMGVPVLALAGEGIVARQSVAILQNLDLPDLVHDSVEAYVEGARALARDVDKLAALRAGMRERMRNSPVGDGPRFARDLESLYRRMWHARCNSTRLSSDLQNANTVAEPTHFVDRPGHAGAQNGMQVFRSPGMPEVGFVVCSIDEAKLCRLTAEIASYLGNTPYEMVSIRDARSLTEAYNRGALQCQANYIVFCHDDIHLLDPDFWPKLRLHLQDFDIVGPAGTSLVVSAKWGEAGYPYLHGQVAHPSKESPFNVNVFDGGVAAVAGRTIDSDIQALDGVFVAMRRSVLDKIHYDELTFDGFHCYDIDFTYRAFLAGFKLGATYDFAIFHESEGNYGAKWAHFAERFRQKHMATLSERPYPLRHAGQAIHYESLQGVGKAFELDMRRANQEMIRKKYGTSIFVKEMHEGGEPAMHAQEFSLWKTLFKGLIGRSKRN